MRQISAALSGLARARVIDEQPAHDARGHGHELRAIANARLSQARELEVRLVDERRRVEGVVAPFLAPAPVSHLAKPLVDDGHERLERRGIAVLPAAQQIRELG